MDAKVHDFCPVDKDFIQKSEKPANEAIPGGDFSDFGRYFGSRPLPDVDATKTAIDSLKIRIPRQLVTVLDDELTANWVSVNTGSGRIDETRTRSGQLSKGNFGRAVGYSIQKMNVGGRQVEEFLTIGVPSKLLGSRYFEGITLDNAGLIYSEIMAQGVVKFGERDFLTETDCTDIDFKSDQVFTGDFLAAIKQIENRAAPSKYAGKGCRSFVRKDNQGVQFSDRSTTSFRKNPYLKIYHKGIELTYNSHDFATEFLGGVDFSKVVRLETTVKNRKHAQMLWGFDKVPFISLLSMPAEDRVKPFNHALNVHLIKNPTPRPRDPEKLSGRDILIYNFVADRWRAGKSFVEIIDTGIQGIEDVKERSRLKKHLERICERCKITHLKTLGAWEETIAQDWPFDEFLGEYLAA